MRASVENTLGHGAAEVIPQHLFYGLQYWVWARHLGSHRMDVLEAYQRQRAVREVGCGTAPRSSAGGIADADAGVNPGEVRLDRSL